VYDLHRDEYLHLDQAKHLALGLSIGTTRNIMDFFPYRFVGQWRVLD
jgi:hypothetical protein